jgi:hypothetical protein
MECKTSPTESRSAVKSSDKPMRNAPPGTARNTTPEPMCRQAGRPATAFSIHTPRALTAGRDHVRTASRSDSGMCGYVIRRR